MSGWITPIILGILVVLSAVALFLARGKRSQRGDVVRKVAVCGMLVALTAVLGGMVSATVLGIFFVPVFFVLIRGYFAERKAKQTASETGAAA